MEKSSRNLVLISIENYHLIISKYKDSFCETKVGKINHSFCIELGLKYINFSRIIGEETSDYYIFELICDKRLFLSKIKYPEIKYEIVDANSIPIDNSIDKNLSLFNLKSINLKIRYYNTHGGRYYCNDGFNISVKCGVYHYCNPRNDIGPWASYEAGYPSGRPSDLLLTYAEDRFMPLNTIYSYVPEWVLFKEFKLHGGLKNPQ